MAFLEKVLKKHEGVDIQEFLNHLEDDTVENYEDADALVKPILLQSDSDKDVAVAELKKGNILLLNISELSKRNAIKLRDMVSQIRGEAESINGDIARISQDHVLVTPSRVKIVKRREKA